MSYTKDCFTVTVCDSAKKPVKNVEKKVFAIKDQEEYSILLRNHHPRKKANATIFIDGKEVIKVRVDNNNSIRVERPGAVAKKFTFYKPGPGVASNPNLGILKVVFDQEVDCGYDEVDSAQGFYQTDASSVIAGATAYGRTSSQTFTNASYIDCEPSTIMTVLLVLDI